MKVGQTSLLLVPLAIASRGVAMVVPLAIAAWFGVGPITDAWYWALAFPTFVLVLASTSLGTAAIPSLAIVKADSPERTTKLVGGLIGWAGIITLVAGSTIASLSPWALRQLTQFPESTQNLASTFLWELVPFMLLTSTGAVLRVSVEVHGRFTQVVLTPMIRASVVILVTWGLLPVIGSHALPWGLVAGEATQFVWWWVQLRRAGIRGVRPNLQLDPSLRRVGRDLAPILGGEVLVALNLVVDKGFAGWLPVGSVATLEFADRARVIPQTLMESTLLMVAFSTWANQRAKGDTASVRRAIGQSLRWAMAFGAPVLAGMFIGRQVLIRLLFERGAFTRMDTLATAEVLAWYLPGVLPTLLGILAVRAHVIERNLSLILVLGLVSVGSNGGLNALLMPQMGLTGLALATTLNAILVPGVYLWVLRPYLPRETRPWLGAIAIVAGSLITATVHELVWGPPIEPLGLAIWFASIPCFALLGIAWWLFRPKGQSAA